MAISDALRASTALSMMKPTWPETASPGSPRESYSPHSASFMCCALRWSSRRWLRVSEPSCNRLSQAVGGGTESQPLVSEVAQRGVDCRDSSAAIDRTFADIALSVDPQAHEHRRVSRPLVEQLAREVAAAKHRSDEMRRVSDSVVSAAAAARPAPARAAAGAVADSACPGARPAHIGCALSGSNALARSVGRGDLLHRRSFDLRLGRDHRSRFALDVLGRRAAFLFLRLGLLLLH